MYLEIGVVDFTLLGNIYGDIIPIVIGFDVRYKQPITKVAWLQSDFNDLKVGEPLAVNVCENKMYRLKHEEGKQIQIVMDDDK